MEAAQRSVVPRIGEFGIDRVSHVLAGIEQRASGVGIVASSPWPPVRIFWPGHFTEEERVRGAVGECSQGIIDRDHVAAVPPPLAKGALSRTEAESLIDALN